MYIIVPEMPPRRCAASLEPDVQRVFLAVRGVRKSVSPPHREGPLQFNRANHGVNRFKTAMPRLPRGHRDNDRNCPALVRQPSYKNLDVTGRNLSLIGNDQRLSPHSATRERLINGSVYIS
jgi:hypothetical protein